MPNLDTRWLRHLKTKEDKENLENIIRNDTQVLGVLEGILQDRLATLETSETKLEDYDTASWSFKQAHRNGAKSEIHSLLKLLQF